MATRKSAKKKHSILKENDGSAPPPIVPEVVEENYAEEIAQALAQYQQDKSSPKYVETPEQLEAFEYYVSLGSSRSIPQVAEQFGTSVAQMWAWSSRFGWVERVKEYQETHSDSELIEVLSKQRESRRFHLAVIDKAIREAVTLDEDGNIISSTINVKTPSDLRTLLMARNEILFGKTGQPPQETKADQKSGGTNIKQAIFIIKK